MRRFESRSRSFGSTAAFIDLLFLTVQSVVAILIVAFLLINPVATEGDVETHAEYLVVVEWGGDVNADVDAWVRAPNGMIASYTSRNTPLMSLDVDDLGSSTETLMMPDGTTSVLPVNREVVSIKSVFPGEYVANVHLYSRRTAELPFTVTVTLIKVNPYRQVTTVTLTMERQGQETTAFRFTVESDGRVTGVNDLPMSFVRRGPSSGVMGLGYM